MSKKQFKDNPALAFIKPMNTQENEYEDVQYETQQVSHVKKDYVRTQGRKGFKKPRINLAFDSENFLDEIRNQAKREGKSITQFVNDTVADYLKKCERKIKK